MQKAKKFDPGLCLGCYWWMGSCYKPTDEKCLQDKREKEVKEDAKSV